MHVVHNSSKDERVHARSVFTFSEHDFNILAEDVSLLFDEIKKLASAEETILISSIGTSVKTQEKDFVLVV